MTTDQIDATRRFFKASALLKDQLRNGWTAQGRRESVAEHSWRLALMAMLLGPEEPGLDMLRVLELCLVHDLGEALNGDQPAPQQQDAAAKSDRERADLGALTANAPATMRTRIRALWEEYEAGKTREAQFVKGADKLETILQHLDGATPPDFDFDYNLGYGRDWTGRFETLRRLRGCLDAETARRAAGL